MAEATPTTLRRSPVGTLIFASRWLQLPLYLGLIVAQSFYVWQFMTSLWHLASVCSRGTRRATASRSRSTRAR